MAFLQLDESKRYHVRFTFDGVEYRRSTKRLSGKNLQEIMLQY